MPRDKAPAFQFYPKDFLTDERVVLMTNTEVGIYVRLLCFCWLEGTLPLDTGSLARMARVPLKQFVKLWEHSIIRACFQVNADGRLHHKRLDEEREKQATYHRRQTDKANARWKGAGNATAMPRHSQTDATPQHPASLRQCSSSPVSNLQSPISRKAEERQPPDARSKRPIYQSDRFVVFEWQLDDLSRMLGKHYEDFDLHTFFDDLSHKSRESGLVIPRDEAWKWLQAQVLAEAKKRKLPIVSVVTDSDDWKAAAIAAGPSKRPYEVSKS